MTDTLATIIRIDRKTAGDVGNLFQTVVAAKSLLSGGPMVPAGRPLAAPGEGPALKRRVGFVSVSVAGSRDPKELCQDRGTERFGKGRECVGFGSMIRTDLQLASRLPSSGRWYRKITTAAEK